MGAWCLRAGHSLLIIAKEVAQAIICAQTPRRDKLSALGAARHDDDRTREEVAVPDKDKEAIIADTPPTVMGDQFRHLRVARPRFARDLDGGGVLLQAATGIAQPRPVDTGAAVKLPTAATDFAVFLAMIAPTDGARLGAHRADLRVVNMAGGEVLVAKTVFAPRLLGEVDAAQDRVAEITLAHTLLAALLATLGAWDGFGGELAAARTFIQAVEAEGLTTAIKLVETRADLPPTFATGDQTVGAEALARCGTDAKLRCIVGNLDNEWHN